MTFQVPCAAAAAAAILAACTAMTPGAGCEAAPVVEDTPPWATDWQTRISPSDLARLNGETDAWAEAVRAAERLEPARMQAEGALVRPDAGPRAAPPPGRYRCRTIKLGGEFLGFVAYPYFDCVVFEDEDRLWLVKETGSQRQSGEIFADGTFLGGLALGTERGRVGYGTLEERNVVGRFEDLGAGRYRLVQPRPVNESVLDILELVPSS